VLPFGKARKVLPAQETSDKPLLSVITYGMGIHWTLGAAKAYPGQVEIIDLRTLFPLDEEAMYESVRKCSRALVVTEEPVDNSFAQTLVCRIQENCFEALDAPVRVIGSENLPAIPLNSTLEKTMIPNAEKVEKAMREVLEY
jgi:2-oxoisovalerate dehydrogenase E1 component